MSQQDFYRIDDIETKIENGGIVTDRDLEFGIHLLETRAPNRRSTVGRRYLAILNVTDNGMYKKWTPKQKDKLYAAAVWLLAQPEPKNQDTWFNAVAMNKQTALFLLGCVHDQRVLSYLRHFVHDPDHATAYLAITYYKQISGGEK